MSIQNQSIVILYFSALYQKKLIIKVLFLAHSSEVLLSHWRMLLNIAMRRTQVESNKSTNFKWPEEATRLIKEHIHAFPNQILRKLKVANVLWLCANKKPTLQ